MITSLGEKRACPYVFVHLYVYLDCFIFCLFLFLLVSRVGCVLWLFHNLEFSFNFLNLAQDIKLERNTNIKVGYLTQKAKSQTMTLAINSNRMMCGCKWQSWKARWVWWVMTYGRDRRGVDQLAKPTFRSRYAHIPFGWSPNRVKERCTQSHLGEVLRVRWDTEVRRGAACEMELWGGARCCVWDVTLSEARCCSWDRTVRWGEMVQ